MLFNFWIGCSSSPNLPLFPTPRSIPYLFLSLSLSKLVSISILVSITVSIPVSPLPLSPLHVPICLCFLPFLSLMLLDILSNGKHRWITVSFSCLSCSTVTNTMKIASSTSAQHSRTAITANLFCCLACDYVRTAIYSATPFVSLHSEGFAGHLTSPPTKNI